MRVGAVEATSLANTETARVVKVTQFELPADKRCQVTVTVKNSGGQTLTGDIYLHIFYGFDFPSPSGDPATDFNNWFNSATTEDYGEKMDVTLKPGDETDITGESPLNASALVSLGILNVGDILDVGIVIAFDDGTGKKYVDSVFYDDYIKIVEAAAVPKIASVKFEVV